MSPIPRRRDEKRSVSPLGRPTGSKRRKIEETSITLAWKIGKNAHTGSRAIAPHCRRPFTGKRRAKIFRDRRLGPHTPYEEASHYEHGNDLDAYRRQIFHHPMHSRNEGQMPVHPDNGFQAPLGGKDVYQHIPANVRMPQPPEYFTLPGNSDDEKGYYICRSGEVLDNRYVVYAGSGNGTFGQVIRARDMARGNQDVAIKISRSDKIFYENALEEVEIMKTLNKVDRFHCLQILDHFVHKKHFCLVLEPMSLNLRQLLRQRGGGLPIKEVKSYCRQILLGLNAMKQCRMIHCDIKPDNIMVTEDQSVLKLCDFGSVSHIDEKRPVTPYVVSSNYRAPEIILGKTYGFPVDMWSVGCTMYELFTGKVLFPGRLRNNSLLAQIMNLRGKVSDTLIRQSAFGHQHFDRNYNYLYRKLDEFAGRERMVVLTNIMPTRNLQKELIEFSRYLLTQEEFWMLWQMKDLIERMLNLDPSKRISVHEALKHPFIAEKSPISCYPFVTPTFRYF